MISSFSSSSSCYISGCACDPDRVLYLLKPFPATTPVDFPLPIPLIFPPNKLDFGLPDYNYLELPYLLTDYSYWELSFLLRVVPLGDYDFPLLIFKFTGSIFYYISSDFTLKGLIIVDLCELQGDSSTGFNPSGVMMQFLLLIPTFFFLGFLCFSLAYRYAARLSSLSSLAICL